MAKHSGRRLCLADNADCQIAFGQPLERLLDMSRGLVLGDHPLEAIYGRGVVVLVHVIAADFHLLARELVAGALELGFGADGVFRGRIFAHDLFQRGDGLFGPALIARNVGDLVVVRGCDQVLRISRIRAAGMQGHVAGGGANTIVEITRLIVGVGRHQQRLARPIGIRMFAIDFLELLRGCLRIVPLVGEVQTLIVELVRRLIDEGVVLGEELVP